MKMVSKAQSEAVENFSENLNVAGRSLWQDARRRFMSNKAARTSLLLLGCVALFVIFALLISEYSYDHTDWDMMSNPLDFESGHYLGTYYNGQKRYVYI